MQNSALQKIGSGNELRWYSKQDWTSLRNEAKNKY